MKLVLGIGQEHPGDQRVQHHRQQQRDHVEEHQVGEEHDKVLCGAATESESAGGDVADALDAVSARLGQKEPRGAVHDGEDPASRDHFFSSEINTGEGFRFLSHSNTSVI